VAPIPLHKFPILFHPPSQSQNTMRLPPTILSSPCIGENTQPWIIKPKTTRSNSKATIGLGDASHLASAKAPRCWWITTCCMWLATFLVPTSSVSERSPILQVSPDHIYGEYSRMPRRADTSVVTVQQMFRVWLSTSTPRRSLPVQQWHRCEGEHLKMISSSVAIGAFIYLTLILTINWGLPNRTASAVSWGRRILERQSIWTCGFSESAISRLPVPHNILRMFIQNFAHQMMACK
jgi:hypothetical protein